MAISRSLFSSLLLIFGTGFLASLSPCVYPILPITLGFLGQQVGKPGKEGVKTKILLYAFGQVVTFVCLGVIVVFFGQTLGFSSESKFVNFGLGLLLLLAGIFSLTGRIPRLFSKWNNFSQSLTGIHLSGKMGAFLFGIGSALIASPCTSPVLGGVLALIATNGSLLKGVLFMFVYSAGFSLLLILFGFAANRLSRFPRSGRWLVTSHFVSSLVLIGGGLYYFARGTGWI